MKSKILIYLFIIITFFSLVNVYAYQESLGTFQRYSSVNLKQTCSDCSYVNITQVIYPDSTQAMDQVSMTKEGTIFNYEFNSTSLLGDYIVMGVGDSEGTDTVFAYTFTITSTGGNGFLFLVILLFVFAFLFLILSTIVSEELFVYISGVCFIVAGIILMIYGLDTWDDWVTRALAFVSLGLGFIFTLGAYIYNLYNYSHYEEEY